MGREAPPKSYEGNPPVSLDPSSIPSFGGSPRRPEQPQSGQQQGSEQPSESSEQGQAKRPVGPIMPNQDLVKQLLDRMKLKHVVDKQGDLVAPWKQFRTYFMFRGEKQQRIMSVRTFYDRPHTIDDKPRLLEAIDDWNRRTLWPKVYTHTSDDGTVRLIGEAQMLIGAGVALDHFVSSLFSWVRAGIEFDKWLVEQLGLAKEIDEDEDEDADADENENGGTGEDGGGDKA
jgi:hypothetical protein